jgi:hypothetical protein
VKRLRLDPITLIAVAVAMTGAHVSLADDPCSSGDVPIHQSTGEGSGIGGSGYNGEGSGIGGSGIEGGEGSGIGGSGIEGGEGSGIGGTGVRGRSGRIGIYGRITRVDDLCINGLRIQIDSSLRVLADGQWQSQQEARLQVGQTVWMVATARGAAWVADEVEILSFADEAISAEQEGASLEERIAQSAGLGQLSIEGSVEDWTGSDQFRLQGLDIHIPRLGDEQSERLQLQLERGDRVRISVEVGIDGQLQVERLSVSRDERDTADRPDTSTLDTPDETGAIKPEPRTSPPDSDRLDIKPSEIEPAKPPSRSPERPSLERPKPPDRELRPELLDRPETLDRPDLSTTP